MAYPLDYCQFSPRPDHLQPVLRAAFTTLAFISSLLFVLTVVLWVRSYRVSYPTSAPITGLASSAPPNPAIPLPIPSDAEEYWVPLRGHLERWEYAPWETKWYRLNHGVPMWLPGALFLITPAVWLTNKAIQRRRHAPVSG